MICRSLILSLWQKNSRHIDCFSGASTSFLFLSINLGLAFGVLSDREGINRRSQHGKAAAATRRTRANQTASVARQRCKEGTSFCIRFGSGRFFEIFAAFCKIFLFGHSSPIENEDEFEFEFEDDCS